MTRQEFLDDARKHKQIFTELIKEYHPSYREPFTRDYDNITAPNPEAACVVVRRQIRLDTASKPLPDARFISALDSNIASEVYTVLNETWFGLPESRSIYNVPGVNELCDLLSDGYLDDMDV